MNYEKIYKRLSTAIDLITVAEEDMKKEIDWDDTEAVDLAYGLREAGGRLLKIRHEIHKKYKEKQPWHQPTPTMERSLPAMRNRKHICAEEIKMTVEVE